MTRRRAVMKRAAPPMGSQWPSSMLYKSILVNDAQGVTTRSSFWCSRIYPVSYTAVELIRRTRLFDWRVHANTTRRRHHGGVAHEVGHWLAALRCGRPAGRKFRGIELASAATKLASCNEKSGVGRTTRQAMNTVSSDCDKDPMRLRHSETLPYIIQDGSRPARISLPHRSGAGPAAAAYLGS